MIAIVDYGMGNLRSVQKGFERVGANAAIVQSPAGLVGAEGIVLPGVGAFGQAMENLRQGGWVDPLKRACADGVPLIGICLGMQLLFERSQEMGEHAGLAILAGDVRRFHGTLKVPQMGWNQIRITGNRKVGTRHTSPPRSAAEDPSPLLRNVPDGSFAFFVHSYYCAPRDWSIVLATTEYGIEFASIIGHGNVYGAQFHPEKSQTIGLTILANFAELARVKVA